MSLKLGIVSATLREYPAEFVIDACVKNGLRSVEWTENVHVFPNATDPSDELYRQTVDAGLEVAAYSSYYRLGEQLPETAKETFHGILVSAKGLRAPMIRVWAGTKASGSVDEPLRKNLVDELAQIAAMAADENIKIALEWHKNTLTDTNQSAFRLLDEVGAENVFCLWQPTAALTMEERVSGLRELEKRGKLLNLHMYHWQGEERRPLIEGKKEWPVYLDVLDAGKSRNCLLEFVMGNRYEQFEKDAAAAHAILAQYSEK